MPLPNGQPVFEDLVALLSTNPSPVVLAAQLPMVSVALADLGSRLRNVEYSHVANATQLAIVTTRLDAYEKSVDEYRADRDRAQHDAKVAIETPTDHETRIVTLESRASALEGAVGSTAWFAERPKAAPEAPQDRKATLVPSAAEFTGIQPAPKALEPA
jgi:hypothetical protein